MWGGGRVWGGGRDTAVPTGALREEDGTEEERSESEEEEEPGCQSS